MFSLRQLWVAQNPLRDGGPGFSVLPERTSPLQRQPRPSPLLGPITTISSILLWGIVVEMVL